jgi:hypothetical protein
MMNPELKQKWVAALRSGDYPQGKQNLQKKGKFCCLGVLCEIDPEVTYDLVDESYVFPDGQRMIDILPFKYANDVGLGDKFKEYDSRLMEMNDEYGKSFEQIANHIERNIP